MERGVTSISLLELAVLALMLTTITTLFIFGGGVYDIFFGAQTETSEMNLNTLAAKMTELTLDKKTLSITTIPYFIDPERVLVGFGKNQETVSGACGKQFMLTRPSGCKNGKACVCLYDTQKTTNTVTDSSGKTTTTSPRAPTGNPACRTIDADVLYSSDYRQGAFTKIDSGKTLDDPQVDNYRGAVDTGLINFAVPDYQPQPSDLVYFGACDPIAGTVQSMTRIVYLEKLTYKGKTYMFFGSDRAEERKRSETLRIKYQTDISDLENLLAQRAYEKLFKDLRLVWQLRGDELEFVAKTRILAADTLTAMLRSPPAVIADLYPKFGFPNIPMQDADRPNALVSADALNFYLESSKTRNADIHKEALVRASALARTAKGFTTPNAETQTRLQNLIKTVESEVMKLPGGAESVDLLLARSAFDSGDYKLAITKFTEYLTRHKESGSLGLAEGYLGMSYQRTDRPIEAVTHYAIALRIDNTLILIDKSSEIKIKDITEKACAENLLNDEVFKVCNQLLGDKMISPVAVKCPQPALKNLEVDCNAQDCRGSPELVKALDNVRSNLAVKAAEQGSAGSYGLNVVLAYQTQETAQKAYLLGHTETMSTCSIGHGVGTAVDVEPIGKTTPAALQDSMCQNGFGKSKKNPLHYQLGAKC